MDFPEVMKYLTPKVRDDPSCLSFLLLNLTLSKLNCSENCKRSYSKYSKNCLN